MLTMQATIVDGTLVLPQIPANAIATHCNGTVVTVYEPGDDVPAIDYQQT
jgi:hypothetical protein